ncbi:MAG: glutamate racemase [Pseudobdellovibrionaceae bacterium]
MAKIGVFDSGVGGLTVLRELASHFPGEDFIYLGDTARLPYGTKSPDTIRAYSEQVLNFLVDRKVDALVIACNTASSQVAEKEWMGIPVFNVIEPGAEQAFKTSENKKIGVLGTRATIASQAYSLAIQKLSENAEVYSQSCPLFVPLAEEGLWEDPITNLITYRYVQPLLLYQIDTLILGCTHYPLLKSAIQKAAGNSVQLVDSGKAIAEQLELIFQSGKLSRTGKDKGEMHILATDLSVHTQTLAEQILKPLEIHQFEVVHIEPKR